MYVYTIIRYTLCAASLWPCKRAAARLLQYTRLRQILETLPRSTLKLAVGSSNTSCYVRIAGERAAFEIFF